MSFRQILQSLNHSDSDPANDAVAQFQLLAASADNDDLISFYKRTNNAVRRQIVDSLSEFQEKLLREFYLRELDVEVTKLEDAGHHSSGDARALYDEIIAKKLSRSETFNVLHTSIDLLKTPPLDAALPQRTQNFFDCMNEIRESGKSNFRWGIGYAIIAGLMLTGAITIAVLSGYGILTNISKPMAICISAMEGLQSLSYGYKMYSSFKTASQQKCMANKMETFGTSLQQPAENAPEDAHEDAPSLTQSPTL